MDVCICVYALIGMSL